jgi:hypothetical protein
MEMPEKCGLCSLFHYEYPTYCTALIGKRKSVVAPYGMPRPNWCPLEELPKKHGDPIDRDVVKKAVCSQLGIKDEVYLLPSEKVVFKQIVEAEAVIEAEGEG